MFDDGTEVTQELDEVPELQTVDVDAVETTTVELRLVEVTDAWLGLRTRATTPRSAT